MSLCKSCGELLIKASDSLREVKMIRVSSDQEVGISLIMFFLFAGLLFFLVNGCSNPEPKKLPVLRIGHAPHDHHAPFYIAAMNPDFFLKDGGIYLEEITFGKEYVLMADERPLAEVIVTTSTGGKKLVRTLDEELNDITFGGVPAMLSFIDQGSDMQILMPVMSEGDGLVVNNDIPADNWEEFADYVRSRKEPVKIGYKIALSVQGLILEKALKSAAIPFAQNTDDTKAETGVVLVNLYGAKNLIPALENGIIDGFVVNQPYVAYAVQQGKGKMIASLSDLPPDGKWKNNPCCALAGNRKYVTRHPQVVEQFLILLLRANRFINQYPEKSADQIARWLNISPEIERLSLPTIKYIVDYDDNWNRGVDSWVEMMIEAGKIRGDVKTAYEAGHLHRKIYDMSTFTKAKSKE